MDLQRERFILENLNAQHELYTSIKYDYNYLIGKYDIPVAENELFYSIRLLWTNALKEVMKQIDDMTDCTVIQYTRSDLTASEDRKRRVRNTFESNERWIKQMSDRDIPLGIVDVERLADYRITHHLARHDNELVKKQIAAYVNNSSSMKSFMQVYQKKNDEKYNKYRYFYDTLYENITGSLRIKFSFIYRNLLDVINRHRMIEPIFFDRLLRIVTDVDEDMYDVPFDSDEEIVRIVTTHILNYAPSATLAQLYSYVGKNEVSFREICEFCIQLCNNDKLFQQRTLYIIQRYLSMGDRAAVQIVDDYCYFEFLLYPLSIRRTRRCHRSDEEDDDNNNSECEDMGDMSATVNECGETSAFNDFSRKNFSPLDMIKVCCDYLSKNQIDIFQSKNFNCAINVFSLTNTLYWRYDGYNYVDVTRNTILQLQSLQERQFVKEFANQVTLKSLRENETLDEMEYERDVEMPFNKRKKRKSKNDAEQATNNNDKPRNRLSTIEMIIDQMIRFLRNFTLRSKGISTENMPNVMLCNSDAGNMQESATSDKFVRYRDKTTNDTILLNLYLHRFEHVTPSVTKLLCVDYDDFQPPQSLRFNEIIDSNIRLYTRLCLDRAPSYFRNITSRDAVSMYLYTRVISDRVNKSSSGQTVQPSVTTKNETLTKNIGMTNLETETVTSEPNQEQRSNQTVEEESFYCDVNDLLLKLPKQLCLRNSVKILESSNIARAFAIICLNVIQKFDASLFDSDDCAYRWIDLLCSAKNDNERMLYGDLSCRAKFDESTKVCVAITSDKYSTLKTRKRVTTDDPFEINDTTINRCKTDRKSNNNNNDKPENVSYQELNTAERLLHDIDRYRKVIRLLLPETLKVGYESAISADGNCDNNDDSEKFVLRIEKISVDILSSIFLLSGFSVTSTILPSSSIVTLSLKITSSFSSA